MQQKFPPVENLLHLRRISYESGCPRNRRNDDLLAQGQESKVDGAVSHSQVSVYYPWPSAPHEEQYTVAIN